MDTRRIFLSLLGTAALLVLVTDARAQRFDHEEIIEQSFTVAPGQTLHLTSDVGSIRVTGGNGNRVDVRILKGVDGGSESRAEDLFQRFNVSFEQAGQELRIDGDYEGQAFQRGRNGLRVAYEIRVPRTFHVDLNTAGGSLNVSAIDGNARLNTSGGSISLQDIQGIVDAETSGGSISAENIGGNTTLETSGGSITLSDIDGTARVNTSGGSISAERIAGDLEGETSGGGISLRELSGSVNASTSGGGIVAHLTGQPRGPVRLSTSGGSVTVHLESGVRMDIEAHASGGGVRSEIPVTGRLERSSVRGTINGGGPLLSLHSSGGGVSIRER